MLYTPLKYPEYVILIFEYELTPSRMRCKHVGTLTEINACEPVIAAASTACAQKVAFEETRNSIRNETTALEDALKAAEQTLKKSEDAQEERLAIWFALKAEATEKEAHARSFQPLVEELLSRERQETQILAEAQNLEGQARDNVNTSMQLALEIQGKFSLMNASHLSLVGRDNAVDYCHPNFLFPLMDLLPIAFVGSREIAVAQAVAAYEAANATLAAIGEAVVDALAGIAAYEEEVRRRKVLVALAIESLEAVADEMEVAMTARSEVELRSEAANASYARQEVGALSASQLGPPPAPPVVANANELQ